MDFVQDSSSENIPPSPPVPVENKAWDWVQTDTSPRPNSVAEILQRER